MSTRLLPPPRQQWSDANGVPLSGGLITTYEAGTTTPKVTWQDALKTVANPNPIVLNSRGEAVIYWDGTYKVQVRNVAGTLIYEQDNYGAGEQVFVADGAALNANGDFERDTNGDGLPDNWTVTALANNTVALDATAANVYSGGEALKFTSTDATKAGTAIGDLVPIAGGAVLQLTGQVRSNAAGITNEAILDWYSASKTLLSSSVIYNAASPTTYTAIDGHATAPSDARFASVRLEGASGAVGSAWFDAIKLMAYIAPPPPTALGDGQSWQNLTASRSLGTAYTNTTGRSIAIKVRASPATSTNPIALLGRLNGTPNLVLDLKSAAPISGLVPYTTVGFVVPDGKPYLVYSYFASEPNPIYSWFELR